MSETPVSADTKPRNGDIARITVHDGPSMQCLIAEWVAGAWQSGAQRFDPDTVTVDERLARVSEGRAVEHHVEVWRDDVTRLHGWECFTCGAERGGYLTWTAADDGAVTHAQGGEPPMSEHDDSAEVERLKVTIASTRHDIDLSHDGTPGEEEDFIARAVLADLRERGWRSPGDVAEMLRDALLAQRAEIEETHILVPREGAEEVEEWGVRLDADVRFLGRAGHVIVYPDRHRADLGTQFSRGNGEPVSTVRRIAVYGPWQVAE